MIINPFTQIITFARETFAYAKRCAAGKSEEIVTQGGLITADSELHNSDG